MPSVQSQFYFFQCLGCHERVESDFVKFIVAAKTLKWQGKPQGRTGKSAVVKIRRETDQRAVLPG
jgi:hypothetical protein